MKVDLGKFRIWWIDALCAVGPNRPVAFYTLPNNGNSWAAWRLKLGLLNLYWMY